MKLLITGAWRNAAEYTEVLEAMGHEVSFQPYESDALSVEPGSVESLVCSRSFFRHHDIAEMTSLRYIQVTASGTDGMPLEYISSRGIELHTAVGVYSAAMAEHALAIVLAYYRCIPTIIEHQRAHVWDKTLPFRELSGSKVLIVGLGSVGRACAERFEAMGCKVTGLHRNDDPADYLAEADIVIISTALTDETRGLIDADRARLIKDDAVVICLSRAEVIDEEAMAILTGEDNNITLAMDCYREEPLAESSELWDADGVLVSPHVSYKSPESSKRLAEVVINNLKNDHA